MPIGITPAKDPSTPTRRAPPTTVTSTCYHPLFCFNNYGDCEGVILRPGNVHSSDGWEGFLEPIVKRYRETDKKLYLRGDAAFASPGV